MEKESKYSVVAHKFLGYGETGSATYEITFNKSLEHTGRFKAIEDGLNSYYSKDSDQAIINKVLKEFFETQKVKIPISLLPYLHRMLQLKEEELL
jgi:hypothetical protein